MKKNIKAFLIALTLVTLCGCGMEEQTQKLINENSDVTLVPVNTDENYAVSNLCLVYDENTMIVYYFDGYEFNQKTMNYMCPYFSSNGYMCRYNSQTKEIEEIIH